MNGAKEIAAMMQAFRDNPPKEIAGSKVARLLDYQTLEDKNLDSGVIEKLDFPKSNVLQFILENGDKISARPSGTEPKIKFYFSVNTTLEDIEDFDRKLEGLKGRIQDIIKSMGLG